MKFKFKVTAHTPTSKGNGKMIHFVSQFNETIMAYINEKDYGLLDKYRLNTIHIMDLYPSRSADGLQLSIKLEQDIPNKELF